MNLNTFLFEKINSFALKSSCLDNLGIFFAQYFEWVLVLALILFLIKNRQRFLYLFSGVFFSTLLARGVITEAIRYFFPVARPFLINNVNLLLNPVPTPAFPSGHAAFYFALSAYIFFYHKKMGIFFFVGAFLISFARIFVGLHWPLDILGGILVGIFSAWLIWHFQRKRFKPSD